MLDCLSEGTDSKGYRENNQFTWRTIIQKRKYLSLKYIVQYTEPTNIIDEQKDFYLVFRIKDDL